MTAPSAVPPAAPPSSPPARLTLEEFYALPNADEPMELVRGEIRPLSPAHGPASRVASNVFWLLSAHVRPRQLGVVFGDNSGFALLGAVHTSRSPDVAFVSNDRLPPGGIKRGPLRMAPDLVVEVLSPSETASTLEEKVDDYREAGTVLVWVVDPERRRVTVRPMDAPTYSLGQGETLTGGRVLPEFTCAVAELFEGLAAD